MTATFDGYLYVAENGAESDNGHFWQFFNNDKPSPCPDMPAEITFIGGPLDGHTKKRGPTGYDARTLCYSLTLHLHTWIKVRLDIDHSAKGRESVIDALADRAARVIYGSFDVGNCKPEPLLKSLMQKHVTDFVQEYYSI